MISIIAVFAKAYRALFVLVSIIDIEQVADNFAVLRKGRQVRSLGCRQGLNR